MDSNPEQKKATPKPQQAGGQQQQKPNSQKHQPTVNESVDILKRLAAFNSKKEEMLKKISEIGDKMQKRLGDLKVGLPSGKEILEEELKEARAEREKAGRMVPPTQAFMDGDMTHLHGRQPQQQPQGQATMEADPVQKIAYTRIRETPKPILVDGCFNISMPLAKLASDEEWKEGLGRIGESPIAEEGANGFFCDDEGLTILPGRMVAIATGLKVSVPAGLALKFATIPGLTILSPTLFTKHYKEMELVFMVRNDTMKEGKLPWGVPLFTGHPVKIRENLDVDELLNSTYDDWIHGNIK